MVKLVQSGPGEWVYKSTSILYIELIKRQKKQRIIMISQGAFTINMENIIEQIILYKKTMTWFKENIRFSVVKVIITTKYVNHIY